MKSSMKKNKESKDGALVFDMDGTLVDTSGDIVHSINHIRDMLGQCPLSSEEVLRYIGHGNPHLLSHVTGIEEGDPELERVRQTFREFYLAHQTERSHPYPGIRDALECLARDYDYDLYVLSNKPHVAVLAELKGHMLFSYFKAIWGAGALAHMKPDPIGIQTAANMSGLSLLKTVMIGDMLPDIQAARNAGSKSCFVSWGFGKISPEFPTPSAIIDSVAELVPKVAAIIDTA